LCKVVAAGIRLTGRIPNTNRTPTCGSGFTLYSSE
jgi:hypothetical protein